MTQKEILEVIKKDLASGKVKVEARDTYRVYTDGTKEVMIGEPAATFEAYYNTFINPVTITSNDAFNILERCNIFVGNPDTGKTYKACHYCEENNIPYILIPGRDDLTLETLLEDFVLIDGKPAYQESTALKMLTGKDKCVIIIDEFNTLRTGVMKTFQPLLDNTSKYFTFRSTSYKKNLNCKFILTLNDKDKGISILPDAILSRSKFTYFYPVKDDTLSEWTGYNVKFIKTCKELFNVLELLPIFGTRQLNIIYNAPDIDTISAHLIGLLSMRNKDFALINTPEIQARLQVIQGCKI